MQTEAYKLRCIRSYGGGDTMAQTWLHVLKIFPRGMNFFDDPHRIRSSVLKCNKKIFPWGKSTPWVGDMTLLEVALVSENAIKFLALGGEIHRPLCIPSGGNPPTMYGCVNQTPLCRPEWEIRPLCIPWGCPLLKEQSGFKLVVSILLISPPSA